MDKKVEYMAILLVAVIASAATSYGTTLYLSNTDENTKPLITAHPSNAIQTSIANSTPSSTLSPSIIPTPTPTSSPIQQPARNRITASYSITLIQVQSYVTVYSGEPIRNLTIVYNYTNILNGTVLKTEVCYGNYSPVFEPNRIVRQDEIQSQRYEIPSAIMSVCSSINVTYNSNINQNSYEWIVYPKLDVTEVYGYS